MERDNKGHVLAVVVAILPFLCSDIYSIIILTIFASFSDMNVNNVKCFRALFVCGCGFSLFLYVVNETQIGLNVSQFQENGTEKNVGNDTQACRKQR